MLGMLPRSLDADRRDLERTLTRDDDWDDAVKVNKMITELLDKTHEPDAPLALAAQQDAYVTQVQMQELLRRAPIQLARQQRRAEKKSTKKQWFEKVLPNGAKCANAAWQTWPSHSALPPSTFARSAWAVALGP